VHDFQTNIGTDSDSKILDLQRQQSRIRVSAKNRKLHKKRHHAGSSQSETSDSDSKEQHDHLEKGMSRPSKLPTASGQFHLHNQSHYAEPVIRAIQAARSGMGGERSFEDNDDDLHTAAALLLELAKK
jgi:hypothetical protein